MASRKRQPRAHQNVQPSAESGSQPFTRNGPGRTSGTYKGKRKYVKGEQLFYTSQYPTFEELRKDHAFADKTLFLTELLKTKQPIRITLPHAMGKTLLLRMVECFCDCAPKKGIPEAPPDDAKAWKDTEIWKKEKKFFKQHFGKHPTIFFTMRDVEGDTLEAVLKRFRKQLAETCEKFQYIYDALKTENPDDECSRGFKDLEFMRKALAGGKEFEETDLSGSLCDLAKIVTRFHGGTRTVLLVDEYDKPVSAALLREAAPEQIAAISKFHADFLQSTFKDNPGVAHSVLAGILQTGRKANSDLRFDECNLLNGSDLNQFFAFSRREISQMCDAINEIICIPDSVQRLLWAWCNGYSYMNDNVRCFICSPHDGCCFLNRYIKQIQRDNPGMPETTTYLKIGGLVQTLKPLFQNDHILKELNSILAYDEEDDKEQADEHVQLNRDFFLEDYQKFAEMIKDPTKELGDRFMPLLMSYLCQVGVLTVRDGRLVVPNGQIRMELMDLLTPYFKELFAFSDAHANKAASALQEIARKKSLANEEFKVEFEEFKESFSDFLTATKQEYTHEFPSHAMLFYLASKIRNKKYFIPDKGHTCKNGEILRIDLSFVLDDVTIIIEVKGPAGKSVHDALKEAVYYRRVYDEIARGHNIRFVRFIYIGIKVTDNIEVQICYRIEDGKADQPKFITPEKIKGNAKHTQLSSDQAQDPEINVDYLQVE